MTILRVLAAAMLVGMAHPGEAAVFSPQSPEALVVGEVPAICYSGYRRGQHPDRGQGAKNPSRAEILEDLEILSATGVFRLIRLYDSRENSRTVLELIREKKLPLKVMLGAWLDAEISSYGTCAWVDAPEPEEKLAANRKANEQEVERAIALAREFPDVVVAVNIGNETLVDWNDHRVGVDRLRSFLAKAREELDQPVTTAENYAAWVRDGPELAGAVDFAGVHTYPIWENKTLAEAMDFTIANLAAVQEALPGVPIAVAEAGWTTTASEFPQEANEDNQLVYYRELMEWARSNNVTVFWFEAFDEDWKGDPASPQGAEKHWGLYDIDRQPKKAVRELLPAEQATQP
jgi:exo-beta-1,3-glucanase (GH17 family)